MPATLTAVWANCPVMVGITEAVALSRCKARRDRRAEHRHHHAVQHRRARRLGIAQWNAGLVELMFEAQVQSAVAQAGLLLGGPAASHQRHREEGGFRSTRQMWTIRRLVTLGRGGR